MIRLAFLIVGLVYSCSIPLFAQRLVLSLEGGLQKGWIRDQAYQAPVFNCPPNAPNCSYKNMADLFISYDVNPSGYVLVGLDYIVNDRVKLYYGLNLNHLRFQRNTEIVKISSVRNLDVHEESLDIIIVYGPARGFYYCQDEDGNTVDCDEGTGLDFKLGPTDGRIGKGSNLYLNQEIGARYKLLPKLWFQAGVDIAHLLYAPVYYSKLNTAIENVDEDIKYTFSVEKERKGEGFNNLLMGLKGGASYMLSPQWSLSISFHHSLTPLYKYSRSVVIEASNDDTSRSRVSRTSLGIQYTFKNR